MGSTPSEINVARLDIQLAVVDDLKDVGASTDKTFTHTTYNLGQTTYNPSSEPPGKHYSAQVIALVAGVATIDLTSLPGLQETIDATGLRLNALIIRGEADGSNGVLNIAPGAANPYVPFGAGNDIDYPAGCTKPWCFQFDDKLADVAAGVKEIDLAGVGTDSYFVEIILG